MNTATYRAWANMKARCRRSPIYVSRGIYYDPRWELFKNFLADMGEKPEGLTLERIDNNKGYSAENCRWATQLEQNHNRSNTSNGVYFVRKRGWRARGFIKGEPIFLGHFRTREQAVAAVEEWNADSSSS